MLEHAALVTNERDGWISSSNGSREINDKTEDRIHPLNPGLNDWGWGACISILLFYSIFICSQNHRNRDSHQKECYTHTLFMFLQLHFLIMIIITQMSVSSHLFVTKAWTACMQMCAYATCSCCDVTHPRVRFCEENSHAPAFAAAVSHSLFTVCKSLEYVHFD